mmetsp:Transcript_26301/g.44880  ORF Transcript_26301/g.44880 Transcript_26301/m.44880 type:complete len:191 (+) Transcript_26301:354-926(+)
MAEVRSLGIVQESWYIHCDEHQYQHKTVLNALCLYRLPDNEDDFLVANYLGLEQHLWGYDQNVVEAEEADIGIVEVEAADTGIVAARMVDLDVDVARVDLELKIRYMYYTVGQNMHMLADKMVNTNLHVNKYSDLKAAGDSDRFAQVVAFHVKIHGVLLMTMIPLRALYLNALLRNMVDILPELSVHAKV